MSSESDTPDIDEAKKMVPNTAVINKFKKFLTQVIQHLVHIFLYGMIAGYVLYTCKVAQSNLFPTETACTPYTNAKPTIQQIKTNIFELFFANPKLSQKIVFPYNLNDQNIVLDTIRQLKNEPTSTSIGAYIMTIIQSGFTMNYILYNVFFNLLNQLPEFLILLLGPPLFLIFIMLLLLIDSINVLVNWFTQMKWFFRKNENSKLAGVPEWSQITFLQPLEFFFSFCMCGFFIFLAVVLLPILMPVLSAVYVLITLFSLNSYTGILNGEEIGLFGIITKLLVFYKVPITVFMAIIITMDAYSILGSTSGIFCFLTVILIFAGVIHMNLFQSVPDNFLTPITSSKQANKTCSAGVIQEGGSKKIHIDNKSFNSRLKQISKQLNKINN